MRLKLLTGYLKTPSNLREEEVRELTENLPFPFPDRGVNPNYLAIKILRARKDLVNPDILSKRLGISEEDAKRILTEEAVEVAFPVSNGKETFLNRALILPGISSPISTDGVEEELLHILGKLTGKGFLLVFEKGFEVRTRSFMLSAYAGIVWGKRVESLSFTGVLSPEGTIEEVSHLEEKIGLTRREGIPLLFPSPHMRDVEKLKTFIEELRIPVAILPGRSPEPFLRRFPFPEDYLREVFNIESPLAYTLPFEDSPESFDEYARWVSSLSEELKSVFDLHISFEIALTSNPLVFSFYAGTRLTKTRIPIRFFAYDGNNNEYWEAYRLGSDKPLQNEGKLEGFLDVREPEEVRNVFIGTKSNSYGEDTLSLVFKESYLDERKAPLYASLISGYLRGKLTECIRLTIEIPNSLAFALGYFMEDYKCLALVHQGRVVHRIGGHPKGNLYLLNAFSLSMVPHRRSYLEVETLSTEEALSIVRRCPWRSYVSHESTAKVLSELLGTEVRMRRERLSLNPGDTALIFQLEVRPREGQVFTEKELEEIVENELFSFRLVKVL